MLIAASRMIGAAIDGRDGSHGRIHDLYFSSDTWEIRYVVVDTGTWLPDRQVLLSPHVVEERSWSNSIAKVDLSKDQIERSPPVFSHKPVSRQHEIELANYFHWPRYWPASKTYSPMSTAIAPPVARQMNETDDLRRQRQGATAVGQAEGDQADPFLRSTVEVFGYHIHASDGPMGHIDDLIVDDEAWAVRYLVVDTKNWWPGRKVLTLQRTLFVSPFMV